MKRKTIQEILAESLHELTKKKTIDKITVREIVANCDYSVATFYRYFRDKYELAFWDYDQTVDSIIQQAGTGSSARRSILLGWIRYIRKDRDHIINLISNTSGVDSFSYHIVQKTISSTELYLQQNGHEYPDNPEFQDMLCLYCYGVISFLSMWLIKGAEESDEYIAGVCEKAMPELLRKYLVVE